MIFNCGTGNLPVVEAVVLVVADQLGEILARAVPTRAAWRVIATAIPETNILRKDILFQPVDLDLSRFQRGPVVPPREIHDESRVLSPKLNRSGDRRGFVLHAIDYGRSRLEMSDET
jgi:hypothetical protein